MPKQWHFVLLSTVFRAAAVQQVFGAAAVVIRRPAVFEQRHISHVKISCSAIINVGPINGSTSLEWLSGCRP